MPLMQHDLGGDNSEAGRQMEIWVIHDTEATVSGREKKPFLSKINPVWWVRNDDEQKLDDGTTDWYMPGKPQWMRRLFWELRNPFQNLRAYVLGVQDRNYTVVGKSPVMTVQRDDLVPPETGWQWCVIKLGILRLPFISHSGRIVFYFGWQPTGFFGAKLNYHAV